MKRFMLYILFIIIVQTVFCSWENDVIRNKYREFIGYGMPQYHIPTLDINIEMEGENIKMNLVGLGGTVIEQISFKKDAWVNYDVIDKIKDGGWYERKFHTINIDKNIIKNMISNNIMMIHYYDYVTHRHGVKEIDLIGFKKSLVNSYNSQHCTDFKRWVNNNGIKLINSNNKRKIGRVEPIKKRSKDSVREYEIF